MKGWQLSLIVGAVLFLIASLLVGYLGWVSWTIVLFTLGIIFFIGIVVFVIIFVTKNQGKTTNEDAQEQLITTEEANIFAVRLVKRRYHDFLVTENESVSNLGSGSKKTPIYRLDGYGEITHHQYVVLLRLDNFEKQNSIIVDGDETKVKALMESLAVRPQTTEKRLTRTVDPVTRQEKEVEETIVKEDEEEKKDKEEL